jgi:hypothetical protein
MGAKENMMIGGPGMMGQNTGMPVNVNTSGGPLGFGGNKSGNNSMNVGQPSLGNKDLVRKNSRHNN